jgi:amidase
MTDGMGFASACDIARMVGEGEVSPAEVLEAALAQVERHNPLLNAVVTPNPRAMDEARAVERRLAKGERLALAGLPVGIKDVTQVAGLRTTFGSPLYKHNIPAEDALVVRRLREAGAVVVGKTNTPEFAVGGNDVFGPTRNPWDPALSAGGSTGGGAAALATGMIHLAEGTDLGGSLRIPASFCGVVGLRPSPGLVPTYPADWVWDTLQVTGPMARSAEDVALMLQAVAGPSPLTPLRQPTAGRDFVGAVRAGVHPGLRIAYCADIAGIGVEAGIEAVCRAAALDLAQCGATVEPIAFDLSEGRDAFLALRGLWFVAWMHGRLDRLEEFGVNVRDSTRAGLEAGVRELGAAEAARGKLWHRFRELFESYDYLLTPTTAVPPFPVEQNYSGTVAGQEMPSSLDWLRPTFVLSLTGLPVCSVPCGLDAAGLPVGLQIVGRPEGEEAVLALAGMVQELRPIGLPPLVRAAAGTE